MTWAAEQRAKDPQGLAGEALVLIVADAVRAGMTLRGATTVDLAKKLHTSRPYVHQVLMGMNLTLRTLVKLAVALDHEVVVTLVPKEQR